MNDVAVNRKWFEDHPTFLINYLDTLPYWKAASAAAEIAQYIYPKEEKERGKDLLSFAAAMLLYIDQRGKAEKVGTLQIKAPLSEEELIPFLRRELPSPRVGSAPHVFTLADRGRQYLSGRGEGVTPYFRPSEERRKAEDNPFMEHTLAAVDVLVAAERLCREFSVSMPRLLTERQLKKNPVRVQPAGRPDAPRTAVIPDAWFQLTAMSRDPVSIALELDRSTEHQKHWRRKVAALTAWAVGPYREAFETDNLTVAVAVPTTTRREQLSDWTRQELEATGHPDLADIFLFSEASPVDTDPFEYFFSLHWYPAGQQLAVSLLDEPERPGEVEVNTSNLPRFDYKQAVKGVEREVE